MLQKYRELADPTPGLRVGLNHLITLTAPGGIVGAPYFSGPGIPGAPYFSGPGLGGRAPVTWLGRPPAPAPTSTAGRRPVVAVLDTGLGEHDWLQPPFATLGAQINGQLIGLGPDVPDPEFDGIIGDPLEGGLDRDAGHGTFIAGIIHQVCPDARVLAVRVMPSDGVVDEHQLTIALNMLLVRQAQAQGTGSSAEVIDVISLSLGYYHSSRRTSSTAALSAGRSAPSASWECASWRRPAMTTRPPLCSLPASRRRCQAPIRSAARCPWSAWAPSTRRGPWPSFPMPVTGSAAIGPAPTW